MIGKKIRSLRNEVKISQENLAEKLNVSRQAVTKWETGAGMPDIENLISLAQFFEIPIDELLGNEAMGNKKDDFIFESVTEYDIDEAKDYDIKLFKAKSVSLIGYNGEKIKVRLASNKISDIKEAFKVKLDDIKRRLDISIERNGEINEREEKEHLYIFIFLPLKYIDHIEVKGDVEEFGVKTIKTENIELSGKIKKLSITNSLSHIEVDCNENMEIDCEKFKGRLDINQISAKSKICLGRDIVFRSLTKGIANKIIEKLSQTNKDKVDLIVELNGLNSQLLIVGK